MIFGIENVNYLLLRIPRVLIFGLFFGFISSLLAQPSEPGLYARFSVGEHNWTVHLEYKKTPRTVANFISLAQGTRSWLNVVDGRIENSNFYDGTVFHRIIADFMVQGGSPTGLGNGNPGYFFKDEFHEELAHDRPGILSMANSGPNTNGSQFFITVKETPWLDGRHTVFGEVIDGMDSVLALSLVETDTSDRPVSPQTIQKLQIIRVGKEAEAFSSEMLETPLPQILRINNSAMVNNDGILRLSWNHKNPVRYTLLWTSNFKSWQNLQLNTRSSIDLLVRASDGQLAPMQDYFSNNYFVIYASDLEE